MMRRMAMLFAIIAGLVSVPATPVQASTMHVTVTATCGCKYTVSVSGHTTPGAPVTVTYSFTVTSHGVKYQVNDQVSTGADDDGHFSETIAGIDLPGSCDDTVEFSSGSASLSLGEGSEPGFAIELPTKMFCLSEPPPGKTFDIGLSSMPKASVDRQLESLDPAVLKLRPRLSAP